MLIWQLEMFFILGTVIGVEYDCSAFCPDCITSPRRMLSNGRPCYSSICYQNLTQRHNVSIQGANSKSSQRTDKPQIKGWKNRKLLVTIAACLSVAGLSLPASAAAITKHSASSSHLSLSNVAAAAFMLVGLAILPLTVVFGASDVAKRLLASASRCAVQVFLLGSVILHRLMAVKSPVLVAAWIVGVGSIAGREAFSRIQFTYPKMRQHVYLSVWTGGWLVLLLTFGLRVLGTIEPWFQPRTWVPVAGMLFGNTLSATALAASTITKNVATQQDAMELRLARGATWREAIAPVLQETLSTSLTPTINGLAVTGLVHIPGMMTGQILAGQSVSQAAMYQIMINFLIATTACTTTQLLMRSAIGALVDAKYHRLRQGVLSSKSERKNAKHRRTTFKDSWREILPVNTERHTGHYSTSIPPMLQTASPLALDGRDKTSSKTTVLKTDALVVPRAMASISLSLHPGERIGITGRSGIGKSQILRSLAGLEETPAGTLTLHGAPLEDIFLPEYRTKVCLVPQRIPAMQGMPQDLCNETLRFANQKGRISGTLGPDSPEKIAKEWGIDERLFYQEWSTLSGGEAQRIALAITLSLRPEVLLLDESLSALDDATALTVEATLLRSKIPIIMVTHSNMQLDRFCTHRIALSPSDPAIVPPKTIE